MEPRSPQATSDGLERLYPLEKLPGGGRPKTSGVDVARSGRVPPQAVDVEQTVLGAMIIDPEQAAVALDILDPLAFYLMKHQRIFEAMEALFLKGSPIDLTTLTQALMKADVLNDVGGAYYLTELVARVDVVSNTAYHCRILLERKLKRNQIEVGMALVQQAYDLECDAFETQAQTEQALMNIDPAERRTVVKPAHVIGAVFDRFRRAEQWQGMTGLSTGFEQLDKVTHGFEGGEDIVIGGDTSQGKTAFALAVAHHLSVKGEIPGLYLTAEMRPQELTERLVYVESQIDAEAARSGRLVQRNWDDLNRARAVIEKANLLIQPVVGSTLEDLRASIRRNVRFCGVQYVVVDYIQKIVGKGHGLEQQVASVSDMIKRCAMDYDVPILALSQLTLPAGLRNKRPERSHLRGSKSIANDADLILLIYRPEEYGIEYDDELLRYTKGLAEVRVAKQRNGHSGPSIILTWQSQYATFKDGQPLNLQHEPKEALF